MRISALIGVPCDIITVSNTQGVPNGNTFCVFGIDTEQNTVCFTNFSPFDNIS